MVSELLLPVSGLALLIAGVVVGALSFKYTDGESGWLGWPMRDWLKTKAGRMRVVSSTCIVLAGAFQLLSFSM